MAFTSALITAVSKESTSAILAYTDVHLPSRTFREHEVAEVLILFEEGRMWKVGQVGMHALLERERHPARSLSSTLPSLRFSSGAYR